LLPTLTNTRITRWHNQLDAADPVLKELLLVLLANLSAKVMGIGQTIALEILDFAKDKIILDK
jgi:hypothetical protein